MLAETSFNSDEELDSFPPPPFAVEDVTNNDLFTGGNLRVPTFAEVREQWTRQRAITKPLSRAKNPLFIWLRCAL